MCRNVNPIVPGGCLADILADNGNNRSSTTALQEMMLRTCDFT